MIDVTDTYFLCQLCHFQWGLVLVEYTEKIKWFNHTGCFRDRDMDKWVVWFYVEPFTLHLIRDRGPTPIVPYCV